MSYYRHRLFFCVNQQDDGLACCAQHGVKLMRDHIKARVKALGLNGLVGGVKVNTVGYLNRCDKGPVLLVYPEAVWYTFLDLEDTLVR